MGLIGSMGVGIIADVSKASTGLTKLSRNVEAFGKRAAEVGKKVSATGDKMTKWITGPILGAGAAILALTTKAGNFADALFDLRDQTGLSTDTLQEYRLVTGEAGVSTDAVAKAVMGLVRKLPTLAMETGASADAMAALGLSYADMEAMEPEKLIEELITRLSAMVDPLERNAIGSQMFGGAWKDMAPILGLGAEKIADLRKEAHELGTVIGEEGLKSANEYRAAFAKVKAQFGALITQIGIDFAPLMTNTFIPLLRDKVVPLLKKVVEKIQDTVEWFMNLDTKTKILIGSILGLVIGIGPLLSIIGRLIALMPKLAAGFTLISAHPIVAAIAAITLAFGMLWLKCEWFRNYWKSFWIGLKRDCTLMVNGVIASLNFLISGINLLTNALSWIPGISIPGLGAIGYVDFSAAIGDASRTVAGAIDALGGEITTELSDIERLQMIGLGNVATAIEKVAEDVSMTLDERLTELGTAIGEGMEIASFATERGLGDIATAIKELETGRATVETWKAALVVIERELATGFTGVESAVNAAQTEFQNALEAYNTSSAIVEAAIRDGTVVNLEILQWDQIEAKERLELAGEHLAEARAAAEAYSERHLESVGLSEQIRAKVEESALLEEAIKVAEQEALEKLGGINLSLGDGFFNVKTSFEKGIEDVVIKFKDATVSFRDGMLDLEFKIGDNTISLSRSIAVLQAVMSAQFTTMLTGIATLLAPIIVALLPFAVIALFIAGIIHFFQKLFGGGGEVVPSMQYGGIIPGIVGQPKLIIAHGGEPIGAGGFSEVIDYTRIGEAVAAGTYDAMKEILSQDRGRPIILQIDGTRMAQVLFPSLLREEQRLQVAL